MMPFLLRASLLALLATSSTTPTGAAEAGLDVARADVQGFITAMAQRHNFEAGDLAGLLSQAKPQPRILELIQRPAERTLAWWEYRERLVTESRINEGIAVLRQYHDILEPIAARSGVPAEYLVAITGIETSYGRNKGRDRVLDALVTLGFDYPPRSDFFRSELEHFLLLMREDQADPRAPLGSYAGAMGIAQFMPSSIRAYAVDGGNDGRRDLFEYGPDVFASIANYFVQHGWQPGKPVLLEATHANAPDDPATAKLALTDTLGDLSARGYQIATTMPPATPAMLVPATLQQGMNWRVGLQNFYVITRYNRSALYAMAVHELAQAIAARSAAPLPRATQALVQNP